MDYKEIVELAQKKARNLSYRVFLKLPANYRTIYSCEDISQELLLKFVQAMPKYDSKKINNNIDAFISTVLKKQAITICTNIWDQREKDAMIQECEHETLSQKVQLIQLEDSDFMEKTYILDTEIRKLCKRFKVPYQKNAELVSLRNILNYTLNKMPDEDFQKLNHALKVKLTKYGESFRKGGIDISKKSKHVLGSGITNIVKKMFRLGLTTPKEILKELDDTGIIYRKDTVLTLIYRERYFRGMGTLTKKPTGISKVIGDLYENGAGITKPKEMFDKLRSMGYKCIPSTVNKIMRKIRKERGLRFKRIPNTLTIDDFKHEE